MKIDVTLEGSPCSFVLCKTMFLSDTTCYIETPFTSLGMWRKKTLFMMINSTGRGIFAALDCVNIEVLYAAERALKYNNNN